MNIGYGETLRRDEVIEAARKAQAYGFITKNPEGLDRDVGVTGEKLSGGQR